VKGPLFGTALNSTMFYQKAWLKARERLVEGLKIKDFKAEKLKKGNLLGVGHVF
jgi:hypothetical protein